MDFLEKDLEDIIWENLQTFEGMTKLYSRGFKIDPKKTFYRQHNLGAYGIPDIIGFRLEPSKEDKGNYTAHIDIYELKKDAVSAGTFLQANRYAKGCLMLIEQYNQTLINKWVTPKFEFILVGSKVELSNDFIYLTDTFDNISIITYKINIDGLRFSEESDYYPNNSSVMQFPKKLKAFRK